MTTAREVEHADTCRTPWYVTDPSTGLTQYVEASENYELVRMTGETAGSRPFLSALIRVCDDHGPGQGRSEPLDDILRQHEHDRAGIDDRSHARAPDVGLLAVSPLENTTVDRILQLGVDDDLDHCPPHPRARSGSSHQGIMSVHAHRCARL